MPQIVAMPYGLHVRDGYSIREHLYNLGFSHLAVVHEWAWEFQANRAVEFEWVWKLPENEPIYGLDMAVALKNLGATFAADPLSKGLERVVNLYISAQELLGAGEARKMFVWLLDSKPKKGWAKQCWKEAWEIVQMYSQEARREDN